MMRKKLVAAAKIKNEKKQAKPFLCLKFKRRVNNYNCFDRAESRG